MSVIELRIPDIGGHSDVNVAEVYVKVGDTINIDDNLLMLETDKATMEVPAEKAGVVTEVLVQVGSKINEGDVFVKVEAVGAVAAAPVPAAAVTAPVVEQSVVAAAPTAAVSSQIVPIIVPDLSGHDNVEIIEVSVKVGDTIAEEDSLITLETDKATMEVPATVGGIVKEIKVQLGGRVSQGDLILMVETTSAVAATAPAVAAAPAPAAAPVTAAAPAPAAPAKVDETAFAKAFASPAIRKLARELGVDLGKVKGSGNKGRITEQDVKTFVKGVMSGQIATGAAPTNGSGVGLDLLPWPKVDFAKFGDVERKEMSRIKKISGGNMARNWVMIPHVTVFENADITDMEEFRKQLNEEYKRAEIKVTPLAFLIKAAVFALKKFPEFNASIDGDSIVYKNYYNIGFAADTPNGLTVPVIKDADKKGLVVIAQETSALAKAARDGKLKPTDMQGGTFTVSSLGGLGSTAFTPIINAPEVAILGVSKSSIAPVWNGKEFAPRLMLPLSLSFDHRIIDGALAAKFTTYLSQILSDLRRMAL